MELHAFAKWLIVAGVMIAAAGLVLLFLPKVSWLGKLPGDIVIKRDNVTFYFPIVSCLLVSVLVSLIVRFFGK